jgi:2-iminobutanoate/2-iminopropanoate deaminase
VWSCGLSGNPGGKLGNLAEQVEWAFKHTGTFMDVAGGSPDDIGLVTILVRDYKDEPRIMQEWRRMFPDPSSEPAHHTAQFGLNPLNTEIMQLHVAAAL